MRTGGDLNPRWGVARQLPHAHLGAARACPAVDSGCRNNPALPPVQRQCGYRRPTQQPVSLWPPALSRHILAHA
jgi:hypothetical protein